MKEYFKYFRWVFIAIAVLATIFLIINGINVYAGGVGHRDRTNTECATQKRVFDYADKLSDEEEAALSELIAKREKQTSCDIILVVLNESLKDYARTIDPYVDYEHFVKIYSEQFYEENNFGYDKPNGDGVLLLDNWYREDDGWVYTWLCTTGIAKDRYSSYDIDRLLDKVYLYVEDDPYRAYTTYVNTFYKDMKGGRLGIDVPVWLPFLIGAAAAVIFIAVNWKSKSGKKTTNAVTYVNGKRADFVNRQDIFIRKTVTRRRIQTSSSSGGGGHHSSGGGGGHHGGGGHRR